MNFDLMGRTLVYKPSIPSARWRILLITRCLAIWAGLLLAGTAIARPHVCDRAAIAASREVGVPLGVLMAISRVETGRKRGPKLVPWPWTVNMQGAGHWFETEDQAHSFVLSHLKTGARSFDVGCFQINYKWHGTAFRSIDEMFDPKLNAEYAARFLQRLFDELGSWSAAAGAYHSRTPTHSNRYRAKFDAVLAGLDAPANPPMGLLAANLRPLISGNSSGFNGKLGSLVKLRSAAHSPKPLISN